MAGFAGKVAIVTGAARGIGGAAAERLVRDGASVLLVDREDAVTAYADSLGAAAFRVDLTAPQAGEQVVAEALRRFGRLDILVNNAGISGSRPLAECDDALIERIIGTNLTAVLRMTRAAMPHLPRPGGRIVNVASVFGIAGYPGSTPYAVAKAVVAQLTRQLAADLAPEGILVNGVAPGLIETAMTTDRLHNDSYYQHAMLQPTPLRRSGQPSEVAAVIAFLASEDASFVSGEVIAVDGGWLSGRHPPRSARASENAGGAPILRWNIGNIRLEQDAAGNIKFSKSKAFGKIDGGAPATMVIRRALANEVAVSMYEREGARPLAVTRSPGAASNAF